MSISITETLVNKYGYNNPIFTSEILNEFPSLTEAYIFRLLKKEEDTEMIKQLDKGVYYIPTKTRIGLSTISSNEVATKRYITDGDNIYGIYTGVYLENLFGLTTQIPMVKEIVTNNEATRRRIVTIDGVDFILHKSRVTITKDNVDAYTVFELLNEIPNVILDTEVIVSLKNYIKKHHVSLDSIRLMSLSFPSVVSQKLICNGII